MCVSDATSCQSDGQGTTITRIETLKVTFSSRKHNFLLRNSFLRMLYSWMANRERVENFIMLLCRALKSE